MWKADTSFEPRFKQFWKAETIKPCSSMWGNDITLLVSSSLLFEYVVTSATSLLSTTHRNWKFHPNAWIKFSLISFINCIWNLSLNSSFNVIHSFHDSCVYYFVGESFSLSILVTSSTRSLQSLHSLRSFCSFHSLVH